MDRSDKKTRKDKKYPRVPIKTYKWEDIRRSRKKGGYPWTYLYKHPFDEEADPEPFTMEALRKTKSSSTLGKSDGVEISEITADSRKDSLGFPMSEKMDTLQIITEPDDHSIKNSTGSIVIEECEMSDTGSQKPENMTLESADSSDNISQYLDKEERVPDKPHNMEEEEKSIGEKKENQIDEKRNQDKTLEDKKRKRKLSAESSYSKISLTKSAVMKKIKDTKNKIKVPKLTFPTSKLKRTVPKKNKNSPPEIKKDIKKSLTPPKNVKPVYIHIPLKPPPGQTDEYSYLEDEKMSKQPPQTKKSFKDLLLNIKQMQGTNTDTEQKNEEKFTTKIDEETIENSTVQSKVTQCEKLENEEKETTANLELNEKGIENVGETETDTLKSDIGDQQKEAKENLDTIIKKHEGEGNENRESESVQQNENETVLPSEDRLTFKIDKESLKLADLKDSEHLGVKDEINTTSKVENETENDIFDRLFKARSSESKETEPGVHDEKKQRSKSAEPERRRKLSLESSYSRKSLSKLGILKKLKEASDKIKNSLSRSNSKKKPTLQEPILKKEVKTKTTPKNGKPSEPVYIHIPLKPPEGQTDEFSYLEYGETPLQNNERNRISSSPESPGRGEGVQFIMVTAPSDDEILDDYHSSDVPETPSSENKMFFGSKLDELKELAKDIVDEITPPTVVNKLDTVTEETISDKVKIEEINDTSDIETKQAEISNKTQLTNSNSLSEEREKITVDVEDGLSEIKQETQKIVADSTLEAKESEVMDQPVELKSNLKGESSPVMKKKVSFRRRSKTPKDGTYEDIQATELPPDVEKSDVDLKIGLPALDPSQSMSVDEEKTYLDERIIKSTSLEEDYNKWSKISDHEYEPVNPPPDNEPFPATPTVHVTDTDLASSTIEPISGISLTTASINNEIIVKDGATDRTESSISPQIQTNISSPTSQSIRDGQIQDASINEKNKESRSKFQLAFKQKTDQFKSKLQNIKKPHITMPDRSKLQKFKIERPKFNLPKIPDTTKINLPSFSLPRRNSAKRSLKERQQSTESNDGDSKKQIFDFSTYPRIFKKKPKSTQQQNQDGTTNFATVPRASRKSNPVTTDNRGKDTVRIPLHSEESMDIEYREEPTNTHAEPEEKYEDDREDSVERRMASHIRYGEDIDIDDEYERENHEINRDDYLNRWHHGSFNPESNQNYLRNFKNSEYKVTDLDSPEDASNYNFNSNDNKENYSSGSSLGVPRVGGVLEEINSDEFFLRQKGISQDNIEVGMYLSSEIREAFRTPDNALSKIQNLYDRDYDPRGSNQSLPETQNKRKPIKKPKRKKTPHASQEKIPYDEETGDEDLDTLPPSRPKRRSKRVKKPKHFDDVIPYQETIPLETNNPEERLMFHRESLGILGDDEREVETNIMYENEQMEGKDQPEIKITDPYRNFEFINMRKYRNSQDDNEDFQEKPAAPPRKQKSLKSLNLSENDSILEDFIINKDTLEPEIKISRTDFPSSTPASREPPKRPSRLRSRTNSQSRGTSQQDDESLSHRTESLTSENQVPCVEEPCIQDIRDYMGYAIIDKQKPRDPPLPPPRTPNRHKRSIKSINDSTDEPNFFTVPRTAKDGSTPVRPLRNYSTLGQTRKNSEPVTYENKENIDIIQYIEIDDEPNRDLQSGDVIKKMKDRPLPAPPRPPRKSRPLRDITSKENIMSEPETIVDKVALEESEMSTQTEPLGDHDILCDEDIQEASDSVLSPSSEKKPDEKPLVEKRLITPTYYTNEETVTHGTLVVEPLNGSKIFSDSEITYSKERIVPINVESDGDETSTIPDDFKKLKDPPQTGNKIIHRTTKPDVAESVNTEMEVLKAQKLQVSDLDVNTLTVNKLLAEKIVVTEIDSSNIQTNEISSKSGTLKIGEIELPPGVIEKILRSIRSNEYHSTKEEEAGKPQENSVLEDEESHKQKKNSDDCSNGL